jgi:hypothetical protein
MSMCTNDLTPPPSPAIGNLREVLASAPAPAQSCVVATKRWSDLDPRVRQTILLGGAFEAGLKVAALVDLAQRPRRDVRGSKAAWAAVLVLVNSGGVVPIVYLLRGRRTG